MFVAALAPGLAAAPAALADCPDADVTPVTEREMKLAGRAAHCLINEFRAEHKRRALRWNHRLRRASARHAKDMITRGYFDHQRRGGPDFDERIKRAGYLRGANGSSLGENIAWSTADAATPRVMVEAWIDSPGHRYNILRSAYRDGGVAVARAEGFTTGEFADAGPVVVYVNDFGRRY